VKIIKRVFTYLTSIFIGFIVAFCLYSLFETVILKKKYVNIGGYTFFVVSSGSMSGSIDVNDVVIVKITKDYEVNDIVTYTHKNYFITHRIISIKDDLIITKGDINNTEDDPITEKDIIGKVVFTFPSSTILKIIGLILLLIVIVIIFNFEKIFKKYIFKHEVPQDIVITNNNALYVQKEASDITRLALQLLKTRSGNNLDAPFDKEWYRRFKYTVAYMELIKVGDFDRLRILINRYPALDIYSYYDILPQDKIDEISKEPYDTFLLLMLNSILYQDEQMFIIFYVSFIHKINGIQEKNRLK